MKNRRKFKATYIYDKKSKTFLERNKWLKVVIPIVVSIPTAIITALIAENLLFN